MRRLLAVILVLVMTIGLCFNSFALTDLEGSEFEEAATTLIEYGVVKGYEDNTFKPLKEITRAEYVTLLIRALGLEEAALKEDKESSFTDANANNVVWARPYINKAQSLGIMEGYEDNTVKPQKNVTLAEAVTMQLRAMGVTFEQGTGKYWYLNAMLRAKEVGIIQTGMTVPEENATRGQVVQLLFNGLDITMSNGKTMRAILEAGNEFSVLNAAPLGLSAIQVTFSKAVDLSTALNKDNYAFTSVDVSISHIVSKDDSTVILYLKNPVAQNTKVTLQVKSVKDLTGNVMEADAGKELIFSDSAAPSLQSAMITGTNSMVLTFNEPVKSIISANIAFSSASKYTVSKVEILEDATQVYVEITGTFGDDAITVATQKVADYAGNLSATETKTTTTAKTLELKVIGSSHNKSAITLTFNKDIKTKNVDVKKIYNTDSDNTAVKVEVNKNTATITFQEGALTKFETGKIVIPAGTFQDKWGTENKEISYSFTVDLDVMPPTVASAELTSGNVMKYVFSEEVQKPAASNFTVTVNGAAAGTATSVSLDSNDARIVYAQLSTELEGNVVVKVSGVKDLAGNTNVEYQSALNLEVIVAPKFEAFKAYLYNAGALNQMVRIDFGQEMQTSGKYSVTDLESYIVDGNSLATLATKVSVKIEATEDKKSVIIHIPSLKDDSKGVTLKSDGEIIMSRVANASGQYTEDMVGTITMKYNQYVTIESAKAIDLDKIVVEFSDKLTSCDPNDIRFTSGTGFILGYLETEVGENEYGNTKITYTLRYPLTSDAKYNNLEMRAQIYSDKSSNTYGAKVQKGDIMAIEDGISPRVKADKNGVYMVDRTANNRIVIYFDEDIKESTLSTLTFLVEGAEVTAVNTKSYLTKSDAVEIEFTPGKGTPDNPKVTMNLAFTDVNGSLYDSVKQVTAKKNY